MRVIFALLLVVVAVHCSPLQDRWDVRRDGFEGDEWEEEHRRRPHHRQRPMFPAGFFGDFDSDDSDEQPASNLNSYFEEFVKNYLQTVLNGSKVNGLPPNYHNVTSTSQVVNGSVITVNETIDKQTDDNNDTFIFTSKVIDVKPQNETIEEKINVPAKEESSSNPPVELTTGPVEVTQGPMEVTQGPVEVSTAPVEVTTAHSSSVDASTSAASAAGEESTSTAANHSTVSPQFTQQNQFNNELNGGTTR